MPFVPGKTAGHNGVDVIDKIVCDLNCQAKKPSRFRQRQNMKASVTLLVVLFAAATLSPAKPIEEMPMLKKVGHLTQVADGKFVDLKHATKIVGSIAICNSSFPLSPDGITEALKFMASQSAYRDRAKTFGMFRVVAEVHIDDVYLRPYNAIAYDHGEPQDQDSVEVIKAGLHKAVDWFSKILAEVESK